MSNGIQQKNIYYGISGDNSIPYGSGRDISLNDNPEDLIDVSQIDSIQVNNLIQQLQDNDRYVKRHISQIKLQDGSPGTYTRSQISKLPDGSKIMGGTGTEELVIEQKIDIPISATVETAGVVSDIFCMKNFGNWLLVGTANGLYVTNDGTGYEGPKPMNPNPDEEQILELVNVTVGQDSSIQIDESVDDEDDEGDEPTSDDAEDENLNPMAVMDITDPYNDLVFAASQSGVFHIQRDDDYRFKLVRLNRQGLEGCRKIHYDPDTGMIYVSVGSDIYFGKFMPGVPQDKRLMSIDFVQAKIGFSNPGDVTGMVMTDKMLFASTLSGLTMGKFSPGRNITKTLRGTEVYCHCGEMIGTNGGLYDTRGNLVVNPGYPIYSICPIQDGYLFGSDSSIAYYKPSGSVEKTNFKEVPGKIVQIRAYGDELSGSIVLFQTDAHSIYQFQYSTGEVSSMLDNIDCAHFEDDSIVAASGNTVSTYRITNLGYRRTNKVQSISSSSNIEFSKIQRINGRIYGTSTVTLAGDKNITYDCMYLLENDSPTYVYPYLNTIEESIYIKSICGIKNISNYTLAIAEQRGSATRIKFFSDISGKPNPEKTENLILGLPMESVLDMREVDGRLYVLTNNSLYEYYPGENPRFRSIFDTTYGSQLVNDDGHLGIACTDGIYGTVVSSNTFRQVFPGDENQHLLSGANTIVPFADMSSFMICGTKGLSAFHPIFSGTVPDVTYNGYNIVKCGEAESRNAFPYVDPLDGSYKIANCLNDGTLSIFTIDNNFTSLDDAVSVNTTLGLDLGGYVPKAYTYKNDQNLYMFVLSNYEFYGENGELCTLTGANDTIDMIPISAQPEILSSFLCAEFLGDCGLSGGAIVRAHLELSVNQNFATCLSSVTESAYFLPRVAALSDDSYRTTMTFSMWINPVAFDEDGEQRANDTTCRYLDLAAELATDISVYYPNIYGTTLLGNSIYEIKNAVPLLSTKTVDDVPVQIPIVSGLTCDYDPLMEDSIDDEEIEVCAMWDGNLTLFPNGDIGIYDSDDRNFRTLGYFGGTDLCSVYDGNDFLLELIDDAEDDADQDPYEQVLDMLSGLNAHTFSDQEKECALNAIVTRSRDGSRLSSEFMTCNLTDVFIRQKLSGVKTVRQDDQDEYAVLLDDGIIYGSAGSYAVQSDAVDNMFFDDNIVYFLSSGTWFAKNLDGSVVEFTDAPFRSDEVDGIGNVGNFTFIAAPDLYKVSYVPRLDSRIEQTRSARIRGDGIQITSSSDRTMVVSKDDSGEFVQEYSQNTGEVSEPIRFTYNGNEIVPYRIFVSDSGRIIIQETSLLQTGLKSSTIYVATRRGNADVAMSGDIEMDGPMGIAFYNNDLLVSLSEADEFGLVRIGTAFSDILQMSRMESTGDLQFTDIKMFGGMPIAVSRDGTYVVKTGSVPIAFRRSLRTDPPISGMCTCSFDGEVESLLGYGEKAVLSSIDGCNFTKLFEVGDDIRAVYPRNIKEYYAGTRSRMYRTVYRYELSNNTHNLTISEIKDLVSNAYPRLLSSVETVVSNHISVDHGTGTAISSIDSDAMDISMSNVSLGDWQNISTRSSRSETNEVAVVNDIVYRMEFGDQTNGDITVSCSNFLSSWNNMRFSYIMKQWKSGIVELMVYIPTTHTYYIGNLSGCPQYSPGDNYRPNISAMLDNTKTYDWSVSQTATDFSVSLDGTIYRMESVLGAEACGNSLPLGVYKDVTSTNLVSASMYNSMILPTIACDIPEPELSGMNTFGFQCFGTDAQAVQITYYDPSLLYDGPTFTVRYHPSGASGHMQNQQMETDVDRVGVRRLRKCGYYWPGSNPKLFLGWAFYPQSESRPDIDLQDGQTFDWREYGDQIQKSIEAGKLDLYAVWTSSNIGADPTELILEV